MQILTLLLALLPFAQSTPLAVRVAADDKCPKLSSEAPTWKISALYYHASYIFTTPSHQNSWGYISFNLTSDAVDYVTTCSASSSRLTTFFYGLQWYRCEGEQGGGETMFTYNQPTGELEINATWPCADGKCSGYGAATKELECNDTFWQNPDWVWPNPGGFYSTRLVECDPVDLSVELSEKKAGSDVSEA